MTLADWNVGLLRLLLARRRMASDERRQVRKRLESHEKTWRGAREVGGHVGNYILLKHTLHRALEDPLFANLAGPRRGLWLEFGVLTGLSINITSVFIEMLTKDSHADGFDTFTGLPEAWSNGKGGFYYKAGTFSWAARKRGPTPPVRSNVRLHTGLFNVTLPPFLQTDDARGRPLAWANIDCDLYAGARDALSALSGRLCAGTRLHFHELLKVAHRTHAMSPHAR